MLVAVVDETWDAVLHDGFYPCPSSYPRAGAPAERMAFYRTAPESAITHHARIVDRTEEVVAPETDLAAASRDTDRLARLVGERGGDRVTVFDLADLTPLSSPVVPGDDVPAVRGVWYTTVAALEAAETLGALAERSSSAGAGAGNSDTAPR